LFDNFSKSDIVDEAFKDSRKYCASVLYIISSSESKLNLDLYAVANKSTKFSNIKKYFTKSKMVNIHQKVMIANHNHF
jgi:hypothetical protein